MPGHSIVARHSGEILSPIRNMKFSNVILSTFGLKMCSGHIKSSGFI